MVKYDIILWTVLHSKHSWQYLVPEETLYYNSSDHWHIGILWLLNADTCTFINGLSVERFRKYTFQWIILNLSTSQQ